MADSMKGAILEVFVVSAEGIDRAIVIGKPSYYVLVECGTQIYRSKSSSGRLDKIYWNEKFTFALPQSELETLTHLKLRILKARHCSDTKFVGETMIFLKGLIVEGNNKGWMELNPAPLNVVLKDNTYRGQITIGLKFIPGIIQNTTFNPNIHMERNKHEPAPNNRPKPLCKMIKNLFFILISCGNSELINHHKEA